MLPTDGPSCSIASATSRERRAPRSSSTRRAYPPRRNPEAGASAPSPAGSSGASPRSRTGASQWRSAPADMQPLEIDYVASRRTARWPGVAVLALSLAVAVGVVGRYRDAQSELAALEAAQGLNADRQATKAIPRHRLDEEARAVN